MASNNDRRIYYDLNSGQKYVLFEESITSGGEGSIYNIEGMPDLVAKIYHEKNHRSTDRCCPAPLRRGSPRNGQAINRYHTP